MIGRELPAEWAFLAPLIASFSEFAFPWDDRFRAADAPVALTLFVSTLSIRNFEIAGGDNDERTALRIAVVARALRASAQLRELLWPRLPHAPIQFEMLHEPAINPRGAIANAWQISKYGQWMEGVCRVFLDSRPDDHAKNATDADAMRQLETRKPGASTCVMPIVILAQPLGVDGLSRLLDLLETLVRDSPWIKLPAEVPPNVDQKLKHPSAFTVHELQLTLRNLDETVRDQLRRAQALGFSISRLVVDNADVTSSAFGECLAMLFQPSPESATTMALSFLEIIPADGKAAMEIVVVLSEQLDRAQAQPTAWKPCTVVMDLVFVDQWSVTAQVLPRMVLCLLPVVPSLCLRLPEWTEETQSPVPMCQLVADAWPEEEKLEEIQATVATVDRLVQQRLQAPRSLSARQVLRVETRPERSGFSFGAFHAGFLAVSPWLTTLEIRVWFCVYTFTESDIACILRSLPRLETLLLEETDIPDMSVFLDAYDDPLRAHLRVLSISSGGSPAFVPFLEKLMDVQSVAANTLRELRMHYAPTSVFLGAVVRLLASENETLSTLRLIVSNEVTSRQLTQMRRALFVPHDPPAHRPCFRSALESVFASFAPHMAAWSLVDKVMGYATPLPQRQVLFELWRQVLFPVQSYCVPSRGLRWDSW